MLPIIVGLHRQKALPQQGKKEILVLRLKMRF